MGAAGRVGSPAKGWGAGSRGAAGLGPSKGLQASEQRGVWGCPLRRQEGRLPTFPTSPARPRTRSHPSGPRLPSILSGGPWRMAATRSGAISETSSGRDSRLAQAGRSPQVRDADRPQRASRAWLQGPS